ncbi:MAG: hypothetical protein V3575_02225 [Candidatus Absconditabacteria bacterium]
MIGIDCPVYDDEKDPVAYGYSKEQIITDLSKVLMFDPINPPKNIGEFMNGKFFQKWLQITGNLTTTLKSDFNKQSRSEKLDRISAANRQLLNMWDLAYNEDLLEDDYLENVDNNPNEDLMVYPLWQKIKLIENELFNSVESVNTDIFWIIVGLIDCRKMPGYLYDWVMNTELGIIVSSMNVKNFEEFLKTIKK